MQKRHKPEKLEAPDLISNLPDELLCSIISFLPAKEAIATSLYSKRWKFLWKSLSRLSFDLTVDDDLRIERIEKMSIVIDKFLSSHVGNVAFFHLHLPRVWTCSDYMLHHIEFLKKEKGFERISLSYGSNTVTRGNTWTPPRDPILNSSFRLFDTDSRRSIDVPRSIFNGRFLQVVELNGYVISDASPFEGCVNVKTLKLTSCHVDDKTLTDILDNCAFLENLSMGACCVFPMNLSIRHKKLKLLEIHHMRIPRFYLISKSLNTLVLDEFSFASSVSHIHCPNLRVLKTNNPKLLDQWGRDSIGGSKILI